jgi:hypothetical protein
VKLRLGLVTPELRKQRLKKQRPGSLGAAGSLETWAHTPTKTEPGHRGEVFPER